MNSRSVGALLVGFLACLLAGMPARPSAAAAESPYPTDLLRVADRGIVPLARAIAEVAPGTAVFVGEIHDQASHHWAQLALIRALRLAGHEVAIAVEVFRADYQPVLDRWVAGDLSERQFVPVYHRNWSDWDHYAEIFRYARAEKIPMAGLNVSREIVRQVAREGFSSLSEEQLGQLPPVTCNVDPAYRAFIRRSFHFPEKSDKDFEYFCEAQLTWDSAMAWHLRRYREANPGRTVVVIAGSGHAWKRGIPARLGRMGDRAFRVVLPETADLNRETVGADDADYLWLDLPLR